MDGRYAEIGLTQHHFQRCAGIGEAGDGGPGGFHQRFDRHRSAPRIPGAQKGTQRGGLSVGGPGKDGPVRPLARWSGAVVWPDAPARCSGPMLWPVPVPSTRLTL
ncbi:hypothetical protein AL036_01195 [Salipiger aestuarii]|nr:hypothetical protein AL036_01195 [Salipiger aestuarii]